MKSMILILLAFLSSNLFAAATSIRTDFSSTNLGTAYTTASPQKAICALPKNMQHVFLYNGSTSEVAFNIYNGTSTAAPSSNIRDVYVPGGTGVVMDGTSVGACIYQRSNSGSSITTGYSIINPW